MGVNVSRIVLLGLIAAAACSAPARQPVIADPTTDEVRLEAGDGWRAQLALDNRPAGVWTVAVRKVFPQYGCAEIVALDDLGRCHVLISYSGKWTARRAVDDGTWLGGLAHADVDARVPGDELYVGSQSGNVYQLVAHPEGVLDGRRIAHLDGREVHTLVAARLEREGRGRVLLAFTRPGGLWRLTPRGEGRDGFDAELMEDVEGRVRDALVLEAHTPGRTDAIATVSRHGALELLTLDGGRPVWTRVHAQAMGMGRLARKPGAGPLVLYATCDDGAVWRHQQRPEGGFDSTRIYLGPQGPRGIAAGRFHADPERESVAVFGYSGRVELLTRPVDGQGPWSVETIFTDVDKGHWLAAGELDSRNGTDELVASGYGARVVVLARPPGYGLEGVAVKEQ